MKRTLNNLAATAALGIALVSQSAWATKGTPQLIAVAATPEWPFNAAIMEEVEMNSFTYDTGRCAVDYAAVSTPYSSEKPLLLRVGTQLYRLLPEGIEGYPNQISYSDADGCAARDLSKVKKMTLVFENTLLPMVRQVLEWDPKLNVVTFTTPALKIVTSAGVVVLKHGDAPTGGPLP